MNKNPVKGHTTAQDDESKDLVGKSSGRPPNRAQTGIDQRVGKLPFSYEAAPGKGQEDDHRGQETLVYDRILATPHRKGRERFLDRCNKLGRTAMLA